MASMVIATALLGALGSRASRGPPQLSPTEQFLLPALQYALNPVNLFALGSKPSDLAVNGVLAAIVFTGSEGLTLSSALAQAYMCHVFPVQGLCTLLPWLILVYHGAIQAAARGPSASQAVLRELAGGALTLGAMAAGVRSGALPVSPHRAYQSVDTSSPWPELSLWWYLFSLVYMRQFRYHAVLAWAHPFAYVLPLSLRLWSRPRVLYTAALSLACLFDATNGWSLVRLPLCVSLVLASPAAAAGMRGCFLWLGLLCMSLTVAPLMKYLWTGPTTGNPNFLFNQQLLFTISAGMLVAEFVGSDMRLHRRARAEAKAAQLVSHPTDVDRPSAAASSCASQLNE